MFKILAATLIGASLASTPASAAPTNPVNLTTSPIEENAVVRVAGPFYTYGGAVSYANHLFDLGYATEIVFRYGRYWVMYA